MSLTFTKLFSSITESTIWTENDPTRIIWITMLAMADRRGRVWASIPGLANRARASVDNVEAALSKFLSPDKYSRTTEHEGRRIEQIEGGWKLLNHEKYRAIRDEEAINESKRKYINTRRAVENVERGRHNAEADTEADAKAVTTTTAVAGLNTKAWETWTDYRKKIGKPLKPVSIPAAQRKLAALPFQMEAVEHSIANGWIGLFPPDKQNNKNSAPSKTAQALRTLEGKRR